jgi:hypothetical protein
MTRQLQRVVLVFTVLFGKIICSLTHTHEEGVHISVFSTGFFIMRT